jgi:hypothetical protein
MYIKKYGIDTSYNILLDSNYIGREKGFKQSKDHIEKRVNALKRSGAYKWTDERRKLFSEQKKNKPSWNKGLKCISISESKKGAKNPMSRKVISLIDNKIFDTITDAAIHFGINRITLHQYLNNKRKNKTNLRYYEGSC